jgi:RNA 2',3'-cyclic 3'-phosphodiesterase
VSQGGGKVRLFAALDVPEQVRVELARWARDAVGEVDGVRLLPPESLHVTLCFLGWREASDAERIGRLVAACAAPVPDLSLGGAAWLPPRRPRVLAADVVEGGGALADLQARLSSRLATEAGYEPERRPYRPHATVARTRGSAGRPPDLAPLPAAEFAGSAVTLYRSHLGHEGARYEPVSRAEI